MKILNNDKLLKTSDATDRLIYENRIVAYSLELENDIMDLKKSIKIAEGNDRLGIWQLIEAMKKKLVGLSLMRRKLIQATDERWYWLQIELIKTYPELKYYQG